MENKHKEVPSRERITFEPGEGVRREIDECVKILGKSQTEVLRDMASLYVELMRRVQETGGTIFVGRDRASAEELLYLPFNRIRTKALKRIGK